MKKKLLAKAQLVLPYADFIEAVHTYSYTKLSDLELKERLLAAFDPLPTPSFPEAYAAIKELIFRHTDLDLFDTQLACAYSLQSGHIAQLPTGEGKTLSAVVAALCYALQGQKVHILVFNDYLAKRDYLSSRTLYEFCGLTAGYIDQHTQPSQRREIYSRNIVYVAAKEAGFDYLRDFLCTKKEELLFPGFHVAIVDEADSVLIDEARMPLVLAGDAQQAQDGPIKVTAVVTSLTAQDVEIHEEKRQVCLTPSGISRVEAALGVENLYAESNLNFLSLVNAALDARFLLHRNKDYIVKDGAIQIVDETTGRVAVNRKFPELLHHAVEAKEGITGDSHTTIYHSMTMQAFLSLYPSLCGMTGTMETSRAEVKNLYHLDIDVIPPHVPSIRVDHEDRIFPTDEARTMAVVAEIRKCHLKGQPVLLGTQSVEESERYAGLLTAAQIPHWVLNARNDEQEAELIAKAGELFRVTVSTNMAGRGVDIKLGGLREEEQEAVRAAGGLYVMGVGLNRSDRIDRQLIGRAGRQGDPGESRFFVSLQDEWIRPYAQERFSQAWIRRQGASMDLDIIRWVHRTRSHVEGEDAEARYMLNRYGFILEQQRMRMTAYHTALLMEEEVPTLLKQEEPRIYQSLVNTAGKRGVDRAERQLTLHFINKHWSDYLESMENVRSGIHLMVIGGKNPLDEYHRIATLAFEEMQQDIRQDVIAWMQKADITEEGMNMQKAGLGGATTTWTYMIDESSNQFSRIPEMIKTVSNTIQGTVFTFQELFQSMIRFFQRKKL